MSAIKRNSDGTGFHLDKHNRKIMGVCAGIGRYFGIDANIVRVAFIAGTIIGFGSLILVYLAIGLLVD